MPDKAIQIDERGFFEKVGRFVRRIPFAVDLVAVYFAMLDKRTPAAAKVILAAAIAYFIMPVDAIPDYLFPVGFTDDAAVLALAVKQCSDSVKKEHRREARNWLRLKR